MYEIIYTGQFKRSLKKCVKRGLEIKVFTDALDILQEKDVCRWNTNLIDCRESILAVGNVILNPIGC